ncbi:MAG: zinc ribbon domain-containing protein [Oscillospiraceae bacterium]|nr:zinc ribbon domain-containing protein [Oscillospiraceae bacterium]
MFCSNCGHNLTNGDGDFCPNCGVGKSETPAPGTGKQAANRGMKIVPVIIAAAVICTGIAAWLLFGGRAEPAYWPEEIPDRRTVETAIWVFDSEHSRELPDDEIILSVSPSGRYILTAARILEVNIQNRRPGNNMGREAEHISLYTNQNGRLSRMGRIYIDPDADLLWNDTVVGGDEANIAWSPDESHILMTAGTIQNRQWITMADMNSDVYLINFAAGTIENLTGRYSEPDFLPRWIDDDHISFIRYELDWDNMWVASLMGMNLRTGTQEFLSNLSDDGRIAVIFDYKIHGDYVYFSRDTFGSLETSGFFASPLNGNRTPPTSLLSILDIREIYDHWAVIGLISVQISPDGRWALLTALDQRIFALDIPFADDPEFPQPDPGSAMSRVTHMPWVPYHNVVLFDLHRNRVVNPFTDRALRPNVAIVTAATFAPDGKSLLCAVFGDDGAWTIDGMNETTLFQIRLDDGSFDAVRIFRTDSDMMPTMISWQEDNSLWIRSTWLSNPLFSRTILAIPAAFERFVG